MPRWRTHRKYGKQDIWEVFEADTERGAFDQSMRNATHKGRAWVPILSIVNMAEMTIQQQTAMDAAKPNAFDLPQHVKVNKALKKQMEADGKAKAKAYLEQFRADADKKLKPFDAQYYEYCKRKRAQQRQESGLPPEVNPHGTQSEGGDNGFGVL